MNNREIISTIEAMEGRLSVIESVQNRLFEAIGATGDGLTEEQVRLEDSQKGLSCRFRMMEDTIKKLRLDVGSSSIQIPQEEKVSLHDLGTDLLARVEAIEAVVLP